MRFYQNHALLCIGLILVVTVLTALVSQGVTVISEVITPPRPQPLTVIIDPGHGGEDGGAVSCTGVRESDLNLEISLQLNDLLLFLGLQTKMIRTEDVAVYSPGMETISEKKISDLHNRVNTVNATPNAVLLSIHQNTFSDSKYSGAQVFYAPTDESEQMAELIQQRLRDGVDPANQRQTKPSLTVYLMNKIQCPGVLVECGFLSNSQEEYRLRSKAYQLRLCCAICSGLTEYLDARKSA